MSSKPFLEAVKARHSFYQLSSDSTIPDSRIQDIIREAVLSSPSAFNSQSARLVVLLNNDHRKLWEFTKDILKARVSEEQWKSTSQRLNGFQEAHGTVFLTLNTL
jgi:predicted oxidoreductase (fatty acid repression mutant protein)